MEMTTWLKKEREKCEIVKIQKKNNPSKVEWRKQNKKFEVVGFFYFHTEVLPRLR